MGTRALIHIKENGQTIVTVYNQYDGYPGSLGCKIIQLLNSGNTKLINGFGSEQHPEAFNGMGDLAAYLIKSLKRGIGSVYIMAPGISGVDEEFVYTLENKSGLTLSVDCVYSGLTNQIPVDENANQALKALEEQLEAL